MLLKFIRLCLIFILIGAGFILYNQQIVKDKITPYTNIFPQAQKAVKGISTNKSEEISNQLKKEADSAISQLQTQALNLKLSEVINFFNKGQKITSDFQTFQKNLKKDIENLNKNK